jgi:glycosyltransferase involved in cell wall biosynthesis
MTNNTNSNNRTIEFTVVIPCYNEVGAIEVTLEEITRDLRQSENHEVIVVNDGSDDGTQELLDKVAPSYPNIRVISHDRNRGYGAALKTGIRASKAELIVITDADGTYPNERIIELVDLCKDYDMVVGARTGQNVTYSKLRALPKFFLRHWVSWLAGQNVPDINSGLRVFRKSVAERFFGILSNQFSFTITITLSMLTTYRRTLFVPIDYHPRVGKSKIKPIQDTWRFLVLILRTGTYFAPLRAFAPIFGVLFILALTSLFYDVLVLRNLTDKTVLLFLFSLNVGMFALLADMFDKRLKN